MTTAELIALLQASLATDGDRIVCIEDADTGSHVSIIAVEVHANSGRLVIESNAYRNQDWENPCDTSNSSGT